MADKPKQEAPTTKTVDAVTYFRSLTLEQLKAVHFDVFREKQRADHIYTLCMAAIGEKENPEPTKVPKKE